MFEDRFGLARGRRQLFRWRDAQHVRLLSLQHEDQTLERIDGLFDMFLGVRPDAQLLVLGVLRRMVAEDLPNRFANLKFRRHAQGVAELQSFLAELMDLDESPAELLDALLDFVGGRKDLFANGRGRTHRQCVRGWLRPRRC